MSEGLDALGGFISEVSEAVERDVASGGIQPDFEAMLARAAVLGSAEDVPEPEPEHTSQRPDPDEALEGFFSEVATHLRTGDEPVPDFLAVVSRAHGMAPEVIPESAVDEVGSYAPIIALRQVRQLKASQHDPALDTFVGEVRGHVDHDLVRKEAASGKAESDTERRGGFSIAIAAALLLTLGLGAGLTKVFDLGGGLWSPETDTPSEAMLSPHPAADQKSEFASDAGDHSTPPEDPPATDPEPPLEPEEIAVEIPVELAPRIRSPKPAKPPSRRDRLTALEREANATWQAGKLESAEAAFRKIIEIDGRGSWGESAYGELFTLQRQRGRSSVALWKAYLKRFPKGRFADDARAGLCRRTADESKVACWSAYLDAMPRGSFRGQAQRELDSAGGKDTP